MITDWNTCPICKGNLFTDRVDDKSGVRPYWDCYCEDCSAEFEVLESEREGLRLVLLHFCDNDRVATRLKELSERD